MSNFARELVGIDALDAGDADWKGHDEVIAIVDSGIDRDHPDLRDRIRHVAAGKAGGMEKDIDGHGTHVAGTAAGDGTASGGQVRGMAPKAELVVIGITNDAGVPQLPADIGELLHQAADPQFGAKIINLSWERALFGAYDHGARAVDAFVRERPDVLVVVAAGNQSTLSDDGYPYIRSLGTPASAKNAVTVGACTSGRKGIDDTWGTYGSGRFNRPPAALERVAGDPTFIAPLSGRGPTDFDSIKPDLVAPGTAILAPWSTTGRSRGIWREWPEHGGHYALMVGTSFAAPVVSGAAAVVRQMLRAKHPEPSAALLKAVLVAATTRLPWRRPEEALRVYGFPDFDQGFGRLDLRQVLPTDTPDGRHLWCEDVPCAADAALESRSPVGATHKATRQYRFVVAEGDPRPLRVVLAWTDPNEAAVQNCLSLELQGPGGLRRLGNADHKWKAEDQADVHPKARQAHIDRRNNVQAVGLEAAIPGAYRLTVLASNTLFPPQGYGLCICGHLAGDPTAS